MKYHVLLFLAIVQTAFPQQIALYAPGNLADRFGSASSDTPFNRYSISTPTENLSMRYQQVMSPSSFSSEVLKSGWITAVSFRADEGGGRFGWGGTLPDLQVNLSTTTKLPDALSPIFAENIGTESTVVFGRGSVTVQMSVRNGPSEATTFTIFFQKPFFYDPNQGNLLVDIRNYQAVDLNNPGGPNAMLDAVDQKGDGLSRVFAGDVNAAVADGMDSLGLVCYFNFTAVPEPSTFALLLIGCAACCLLKRRAS